MCKILLGRPWILASWIPLDTKNVHQNSLADLPDGTGTPTGQHLLLHHKCSSGAARRKGQRASRCLLEDTMSSMVLTSALRQREIHHRQLKTNKLLQTEASRDGDAMHHGFSNRCYSQLFSASKISHSCTFNCSLCRLYSYEPQPAMTTSHLVTRDSERHSGKCRETIKTRMSLTKWWISGYVDINFRTVFIKNHTWLFHGLNTEKR